MNYSWGYPKVLDFSHIPKLVYSVGRIQPNKTVQFLGTAFVLNKKGVLATASHVAGMSDEGLVIVQNDVNTMHDYQVAAQERFNCFHAKILAQDPIHDIALLEVPEFVSGNFTSNLAISTTDALKVGDEVFSFGFPHADSNRRILTMHQSSVGAKILLPSASLNAKYIILNALARPGQSGSPIVRKDTGEVVAILCGAYNPNSQGWVEVGGINPAVLHQTTHAVSAEYLKEMLL
jgi:S1-C subfamily serine protease